MARHHEFLVQLENFRHETTIAAQYFYAEMAVQYAAHKSPKLRSRLNETPSFWNVHMAATQAAAYFTVARIFDTKSRYNVDALLDAFESNLHLFSRSALDARKSEGSATRPGWLDEYLLDAHYPTAQDVKRLRAHVKRHRAFYDRAVKPVRNEYLAHRVKQENSEVQALYGRGKVKEFSKTVAFLLSLHDALLQQHLNGRKPTLRPIRYSVKTMYDHASERSGPHERIIGQIRTLMGRLER